MLKIMGKKTFTILGWSFLLRPKKNMCVYGLPTDPVLYLPTLPFFLRK